MRSLQISLRVALVAAIALIVSAPGRAATPRFVFGKEPVARHNRAVAARRAQSSNAYAYRAPSSSRMMPSTQSYGGTAMVQTYPVPQRNYVTPASGYRPQMAAQNSGAMIR